VQAPQGCTERGFSNQLQHQLSRTQATSWNTPPSHKLYQGGILVKNNTVRGLVAVVLLSGPAFAQTGASDASGSNSSTATQRVDDTTHHNYGWIGLLGLVGLAGLRKTDHTRTVGTSTGTTR